MGGVFTWGGVAGLSRGLGLRTFRCLLLLLRHWIIMVMLSQEQFYGAKVVLPLVLESSTALL